MPEPAGRARRAPVNVHLSLTPFLNESRVLKQTAALAAAGVFVRIHVVALHKGRGARFERLDAHRDVRRLCLLTSWMGSSFAAHALRYVELTVRVLWLWLRLRPTVVTIHTVDLLPLAVLLRRLWGVPVVYDCHELETEALGLTGRRQRVAKAIERWGIHRVQLVCVVSESIRDWYRREYERADIALVRNCPPTHRAERRDLLRATLGIAPGRRIVLYQGGLEPGRGIEEALHAFATRDDGVHSLVMMGYGALEGAVRSAAEAHEHIHFHPAVPPAVLLEYTESADVGLCYIDDPSLSGRYCLPNKLFEYLAAGIPVIVSPNEELRRVVDEAGVGVVVTTLAAEEFFAALRELAGDVAGFRQRVEDAAGAFTWEREAETLVAAYRTLEGTAPAVA